MEQAIRFVQHRLTTATRRVEDAYFFAPKRHAWLARGLWRSLRRLHALQPYSESFTVQTYGEPEQRALTEAFRPHVSYLIQSGLDPADFALVVGARDFREMLHLEAGGMSFPLERFVLCNSGYRREYRGIKVHVVDQISGFAMIPRVLIEKKVQISFGEIE